MSLLRRDEVPTNITARVVGRKKGWLVVEVEWKDNADGEAWTVAGYSGDAGWLGVTWSVNAADYGEGMGIKTYDFLAPKDAKFLQLAAIWSPDPNDPLHGAATTGYSAKVEIA